MNDTARQLPLELDTGGEVVLHAPPALAAEMAQLVEALLAEGFQAHVVAERSAFEDTLGDTAAVHVVCRRGGELDFDAMRTRAREVSDVEHLWIDGTLGSDAPVRLLGSIARALGEMEWRSSGAVIERVDVDEVSNVVLIPVAQPAANTEMPAQRRPRWRDRVLMGALCVGVLAMPFLLIDKHAPVESEPAPEAAAAAAPEAPAPKRSFAHDLHRALPVPVRTSAPPSAAPEIVTEDPPAIIAEDPLRTAIDSGKARTAAGLVVSPRVDTNDWFRAMTACRSRRLLGVDGWFLPTRTQLVALARARALPDTLLWSRNKGDSDGTQAIAVSGRAGLGRAVPKSSTDVAIVCVKPSPPQE
jgi:hypothetical protein